jgi:hypothetical protein
MTEMSTLSLQKNSLYQKTHKCESSFRPGMNKHRIKRQVWNRLRTLLSFVSTGLFYIDTRGKHLVPVLKTTMWRPKMKNCLKWAVAGYVHTGQNASNGDA